MKKICFFLFLLCITSLAYAQEISSNIRSLLSSDGKVIYGNEPNSIVVIDYPENVQRVADYLQDSDTVPAQVMIEARVVEIKLQKEHSLGVNWLALADKGYFPLGRFKVGSSGTLGALPGPIEQSIPYKPTFFPPLQTTTGQEDPFTIAIFDDNINVILSTLANALDTNILSAPHVTTVNNREAEIKIIQSLPWAEPQVTVDDAGNVIVTWNINFEEIGILLRVTPMINEGNEITMVLNPEISEKTGDYSLKVVQSGVEVPYTVPIIDKRAASTKVVIGNGQTLIIGGLMKDKIVKAESKIPFLGDIPGLGALFKSTKESKDKTELLIFVSPRIINQNDFVRMAREDKYIYNKDYFAEKKNNAKTVARAEVEEEAKNENASRTLSSLTKKYNALAQERKKLEKDILRQEEDLETIEEMKDRLMRTKE